MAYRLMTCLPHGQGGIRTHDTLVAYTRSPGVPLQPLEHLSRRTARKLAEARENLAWCDGSADLLAQLEARRPTPQAEVLIHGDLALDNVLIERDGSMSLIDWSGGDVGDPRSDIALALATEPEMQLRDADIAGFFNGYGGTQIDAITARWFTRLYEFF